MSAIQPPLPEFEHIGSYRNGRFDILDGWKKLGGIYLWVKRQSSAPVVRRVGIAKRFGARFTGYNAWIAGKGKFGNDPREIEVARLTRSGLGASAEIWGHAVSVQHRMLLREQELREEFAGHLSLDLAAPNSWIKRRMITWHCRQGEKDFRHTQKISRPAAG